MIRWLLKSDMAAVLEIEQATYDSPWTRDDFDQCQNYHRNVSVVYEVQGDVAGYLFYMHHKKAIEILNLAVDPEYLRQGIGAEFIELLKRKLGSMSKKRLVAIVREKNVAAQMFLKSQGFLCMAIIDGHHTDETVPDEPAYEFRFDAEWIDNPPTRLITSNNRISQYMDGECY